IANDSATAVTDMHRAGGISRNIFDIHLGSVTNLRSTKRSSSAQHFIELALPISMFQTQIDEAWSSYFDRLNIRISAQGVCYFSCQFTWVLTNSLRQNHRSICGNIPMG